MTQTLSLSDAVALLWREADMLDRQDYDDWLDLWTGDGLYVVPIEQGDDDFANRLNYAYDDADMRRMRVARLKSSHSISALTAARTVRTVSRFVVKAERDGELDIRAAQLLVEHKRDARRTLAANLDVTVRATESGLKLAKKVIWLVNSEDAVHGMGYLL